MCGCVVSDVSERAHRSVSVWPPHGGACCLSYVSSRHNPALPCIPYHQRVQVHLCRFSMCTLYGTIYVCIGMCRLGDTLDVCASVGVLIRSHIICMYMYGCVCGVNLITQ